MKIPKYPPTRFDKQTLKLKKNIKNIKFFEVCALNIKHLNPPI